MSTLLFLRDVARRPLEMGAILPSSTQLAIAMVREARIEPGQRVLELGAGSGSFTREIVRCHPNNPLWLVEPGQDLGGALSAEFPHATVCTCTAEALGAQVPSGVTFDRVVSGLPWALWPIERQAAILDGLLSVLAPDARLVTFHYVHSRMLGRVASLRKLLQERFQEVTQSESVWSNVPPAYVHIASAPKPVGDRHTNAAVV